jgi:hypothetical protein
MNTEVPYAKRKWAEKLGVSTSRGDEYKNLTKCLEITRPFQVLSSDISYIRTGEGFDYLLRSGMFTPIRSWLPAKWKI